MHALFCVHVCMCTHSFFLIVLIVCHFERRGGWGGGGREGIVGEFGVYACKCAV